MENQSSKLDKAAKISIIGGTLIVALSIAYYLVLYIPKRDKTKLEQQKQEQVAKEQKDKTDKEELAQKELEAKKVKCLEDAKKFHQDYIKTISGEYFEPKYRYNEMLEKCLYSGGYRYTSGSLTDWERVVKDVYTNETILSAYGGIGKNNPDYLKSFWEKHDELMNNK
jgi:hypothetical protein